MTPKRVLIFCAILIGLGLILVPILLIATVDPEWVKEKLVAIAKQKGQLDLDIQTLELSVLNGEATLTGVSFSREEPGSKGEGTIKKLHVSVHVLPLLFRSVSIKKVEIWTPDIAWDLIRPPDTERENTTEKLKRFFTGKDRDRRENRDSDSRRTPAWRIAHLILHDGRMDLTVRKEGTQPFKVLATGIEYEARRVSMESFGRLVYGADLKADIDLDGTRARVDKVASTTPAHCRITNLDLGYLDRYFDQSDALVIEAGTLDLNYHGEGVLAARWGASIRGLRLAQNPEAASKNFMFIPVPVLKKYVEHRKGELDVTFGEPDEDLLVSWDFIFLVRVFWNGLWDAVIEKTGKIRLRNPFKKPGEGVEVELQFDTKPKGK